MKLTFLAFSAASAAVSASPQALPPMRAMFSPDRRSTMARSASDRRAKACSFMMMPWTSEYRPPGNTVAFLIAPSMRNEVIDSGGKNTPSTTPVLISS